MRLRRRAGLAGVSVAALVAMLGTASAGTPPRSGPVKVTVPDSVGDARTAVHTVTLITGDRVTVGSTGGVDSVLRIDRADGRGHVAFAVATEHGHLNVIPSDALPLLRADRLDPRLFDVTNLLRFKYDDRRGDLPLIVTGAPAAVPPLARSAPSTRMRNVPRGVAMHTAKASVGRLWAALATSVPRGAAKAAAGPKVWLDAIHQPVLDQSVPQIGAPTAWAAGYTGAGVTVGIVDTGIDATHPDLAGQVIAAQDFTGGGDPRDLVGHGTHVAATVASHDTRYRGVAPGAKLLNAKVCADIGCDESAMLAGMEWAAESGAKIINMSIGGADGPSIDPLEAEVADLTHRFGVLFVIAAGNDGPADSTIESPGSADDALTVGAVDKQNNLADFSSRGPRRGDEAIKPDITAPGVNIVAARSSTGIFGNPGDLHVSLSGTSMATPHVAGSAAILAQEHPDWSPAQLKEALMGSALTLPDIGVFAQGAGRVDVAHEIRESVLAEPPSVSVGRVPWPHTDDTPVARTVTYHNMSNADETLALSLSTTAPAGMFTLSATTVTVPAGGSASVVLTTDTDLDAPDAIYQGNLLAQSADQAVTTPFAVDKAPETHRVTVHYLDRSGQPTDNVFAALVDPETGDFIFLPADGEFIDVRPGTYILGCELFNFDTGDVSLLADAKVPITADRDLTLDARDARPVTVTLPFRDARQRSLTAGADIDTLGTFLADAEGDAKVFTGTSDPAQTSPHLHGVLVGVFERPAVPGTDSPATIQLGYHSSGRMFTGLTRHLRRDDLATIHASNAAQGPTEGLFLPRPAWTDWAASITPGSLVNLPSTRDEYYNTDGGVRWSRALIETDDDFNPFNQLQSTVDRLVGGREYTENRNGAVYDQGFPPPVFGVPAYARRGDLMVVTPDVLTDALGWTLLGGVGTSTRITLDRDGVRLADVTGNTLPTLIEVPPGRAGYRIGMDITRDAPNTLSTEVDTAWTFTSDTTPTTGWAALPLTAPRFLPKVDLGNSAPVGRPTRIAVDVDRQPGSAARPLRSLAVEVSFDDGATWRALPVRGTLDAPSVMVTDPAAGFVSLRATGVDRAGNTVTVTVIRAYHVG